MRAPIMRLLLALTGLSLCGSIQIARAEDGIILKLGGVVSPTHYMAVTGDVFWMDKVSQMTNGRVTFQYFPAEQLGKAADMLGLVQSGVVDIAEQPVAYVADKLPLSGIVEMPGLARSSCAGTKAFHAAVQPGMSLYESDFKPAGVRVLMAVMLAPYDLLTSRKTVRTIEDVKGLKLRTTGGAMEIMAARLGAVSVRMASPDIYQSFSRGTLDGVFLSLLSAKPYDLQTVAKYATTGFSFGTSGVTWLISDDSWAKLPAAVQNVMREAGVAAERNFCAYADSHEEAEQTAMTKAKVTFLPLGASEQAALQTRLAPVVDEWAEGLEKRGLPARRVVAEFRSALAAE